MTRMGDVREGIQSWLHSRRAVVKVGWQSRGQRSVVQVKDDKGLDQELENQLNKCLFVPDFVFLLSRTISNVVSPCLLVCG